MQKLVNSKCWICNSNMQVVDEMYFRCTSCHHEITSMIEKSVEIINEDLSDETSKKLNLLDKFKNSLTLKYKNNSEVLIDVGSSTGRFLNLNKQKFPKIYGVELSKPSIDFCEKNYSIQVFDDLRKVPIEGSTLVTFWHSLEHIPVEAIEEYFKFLSNLNKEITIIISVPNSSSLQVNLFKEKWPYRDEISHIHQFSFDSLEKLMKKYNFCR